MASGLPMYVVDAFTTKAFAGNPAAVCFPQTLLDDATCLRIASEMNHSETAFLVPGAQKHEFGLRWFTPKVEIDLCGHATLASAAVLWRERGFEDDEIRFQTRSGTLLAVREGGRIRLDFPANPAAPTRPPKELLEKLGTRDPVAVAFDPKTRKLLVEVASAADVRAARPDHAGLLATHNELGVRGIILTARGGQGFDFTSRYFGPWVGIDEDPVTGSAHTVLAPHWSKKLGKKEMRARQDSARGGEMDVRLVGDRVHMVGDAVVVLRGTLGP